MCGFLNKSEEETMWPDHCLVNIIVLMGKPAGGCRPIALMPMIYRLWTKCRRPYMRSWEILRKGPWDAAVRGSSALRAAVLTAFGDEMAHYTGQEVAKILWDMEKFYDSLDICKLIDRANYLGYPSKLIAMGMIMHMAPRVIRAYEHHMEVGLPANGIIAGCTQSNHFARIFLYTVILALGEGSPYGEIRTFVDDIAQTERGKETYPLFTSKDLIVLHTVRRARILIRELRESNLVISEKTVVLANRKSTRLEIVRKLAREGLVCGHGLAAKD